MNAVRWAPVVRLPNHACDCQPSTVNCQLAAKRRYTLFRYTTPVSTRVNPVAVMTFKTDFIDSGE